MNRNFVNKNLIRVLLIYFYFCSFNRRVYSQPNENFINSLNNNKLSEGSRKPFDGWPKLYRKKDSSDYIFSQKNKPPVKQGLSPSPSYRPLPQVKQSSPISPSSRALPIAKLRRGIVKDYAINDSRRGEVTLMSGISEEELNHIPIIPMAKLRRGMVKDYPMNDSRRGQVSLRSGISADKLNHSPRRVKSHYFYDVDEAVDANNFDDELEMNYGLGMRANSIILKGIVLSNCGISTNLGKRIVNGNDAEEGFYPWIVRILKFGDSWCGGTILNEWWILTASHCFMGLQDPYAYVARVGSVYSNMGSTYKIRKLIMHERFHLDNMLNSDIALLKVDRPIKMNDLVNGICLPTVIQEEPKTESLIVVGWGSTKYRNQELPQRLQEVSLKRISDGQCARKYKLKENTIYRSQICTFDYGKDACQGDSGGPAIEIQNSRAVLIGIVSYGSKCADEFPGVYTQVSYFLEWIANNINRNS